MNHWRRWAAGTRHQLTEPIEWRGIEWNSLNSEVRNLLRTWVLTNSTAAFRSRNMLRVNRGIRDTNVVEGVIFALFAGAFFPPPFGGENPDDLTDADLDAADTFVLAGLSATNAALVNPNYDYIGDYMAGNGSIEITDTKDYIASGEISELRGQGAVTPGVLGKPDHIEMLVSLDDGEMSGFCDTIDSQARERELDGTIGQEWDAVADFEFDAALAGSGLHFDVGTMWGHISFRLDGAGAIVAVDSDGVETSIATSVDVTKRYHVQTRPQPLTGRVFFEGTPTEDVHDYAGRATVHVPRHSYSRIELIESDGIDAEKRYIGYQLDGKTLQENPLNGFEELIVTDAKTKMKREFKLSNATGGTVSNAKIKFYDLTANEVFRESKQRGVAVPAFS
jgi:hypothetical protein